MPWQDLLQKPKAPEAVTLPWLGNKTLRLGPQAWALALDQLPEEHGWYRFAVEGRRVTSPTPAEPAPQNLGCGLTEGYLVGDLHVGDGARVPHSLADITKVGRRCYLIPEGLDLFARVVAGSTHEHGKLVYRELAMPLGPEDKVLEALLDGRSSVDHVKGVHPALDAAFRLERWRRAEVERLREEHALRLRQERERLEREVLRRRVVEGLGDGAGRREVAKVDFDAAALTALALSGAQFVDARRVAGGMAVRFRLDRQRFECVCDRLTLQILDSGVCLTNHLTGEKTDARFTLESLPSVIREAIRDDKLVVYRHW